MQDPKDKSLSCMLAMIPIEPPRVHGVKNDNHFPPAPSNSVGA